MVDQILSETKTVEQLEIPQMNIKDKENLGKFFKLQIAGTPKLDFSVTDTQGKELYSHKLNVEMG